MQQAISSLLFLVLFVLSFVLFLNYCSLFLFSEKELPAVQLLSLKDQSCESGLLSTVYSSSCFFLIFPPFSSLRAWFRVIWSLMLRRQSFTCLGQQENCFLPFSCPFLCTVCATQWSNYARTIFSKTQDSKLSTFQGMPFLPLMALVGSTCVSAWIFASISENFILRRVFQPWQLLAAPQLECCMQAVLPKTPAGAWDVFTEYSYCTIDKAKPK